MPPYLQCDHRKCACAARLCACYGASQVQVQSHTRLPTSYTCLYSGSGRRRRNRSLYQDKSSGERRTSSTWMSHWPMSHLITFPWVWTRYSVGIPWAWPGSKGRMSFFLKNYCGLARAREKTLYISFPPSSCPSFLSAYTPSHTTSAARSVKYALLREFTKAFEQFE